MAITNLLQNDPRWANHPFAGETMAPAGCGPTSVADLLGHDQPVTVADWMQAHGYASNGSGTYHSGIAASLKAFGYSGEQITGSSLAGVMNCSQFEAFKAHIKSGYCGIILFGGLGSGCRNSYWSNYGHYCACVGTSNGKFLVYDPAWSVRTGYHGWDSDIAGCVKHLFTSTVKWKASGSSLKVDGAWGEKTTKFAQKVFKTSVDGVVSNQNKDRAFWLQNCQMPSWEFVDKSKLRNGSELIRAIQRKIGVTADGFMGDTTTKALQKFLGVKTDGLFGPASVSAFQTWLNENA